MERKIWACTECGRRFIDKYDFKNHKCAKPEKKKRSAPKKKEQPKEEA